jgi:transposase InsO family protein
VLVELSVVEQRYQAVMEVLSDGLTVTEVAERYGVSRQIVHRWIRRYEESGLNGLADRSHRPKACAHQISAEVEAAICELRRLHRDWGPRTLLDKLERRGVAPLPTRSSIYRALVRNNLIEPKRRRRRKLDYRRWERKRPMELWQLDIMGQVFLANGTELKVITSIDDHSRFCVIAKVVERPTGRAVCAAFVEAMTTYGIPDEVLTDNGKQFTGRFAKVKGEVLFERCCRQNGIHHILTAVRSPTTTGKVERFHETLRREHFNKHTFDSIETAQAALDVYVDTYNRERPHQMIGGLTPAERFRFGTKTEIPGEDSVIPERRSITEIQRRVWVNGVISVAYQRIQAGRHLAGQIVTVRIEPTVLHVLLDGELIKTVPRRSEKEVRQIRAHKVHSYPQKTG